VDVAQAPERPPLLAFLTRPAKKPKKLEKGVDIQLNVEYFINGMPAFGNMLRRRRRESGISQRELARRVRVDFSYISKLENGRLPAPAAETIVRLSNAIGASPEELLASAKKMTSEVSEKLSGKPAALRFVHEATRMGLSEDEWTELTKSLRDLRS
jgi:transcriptional regulator with XRE-family HTH domain